VSFKDRFIIFIREVFTGWNYFFEKTRHRIVSKIAESVLMNMDIMNAVDGAKTSAACEKEHLLEVDTFKSRRELFRHALSLLSEQGLLLEFGTYRGDSINLLAKMMPGSKFYGFDSFQGLPERWTVGTREGGLSTGGVLPSVRDNVELVQGFFEESLPPFFARHPEEAVVFAHIDCDLYSSTLTILDNIYSRMKVGTVLVFDEYYNYADWLEGEYKAWIEFCDANKVGFKYIGYIRMGSQLTVQITALPDAH